MSHYYYFLGDCEQGSLVAACWVSNIFNGSTLLTQVVFILSMTAYLKCKPTRPNLSENSISQANNSLQVIISLFFCFSEIKEVDLRFKEQEHEPSVVELNFCYTNMLWIGFCQYYYYLFRQMELRLKEQELKATPESCAIFKYTV